MFRLKNKANPKFSGTDSVSRMNRFPVCKHIRQLFRPALQVRGDTIQVDGYLVRLQRKAKIDGARSRLFSIRRSTLKADSLIHCDRLTHYRHAVAQHFGVSCSSGFMDYPFEKRSAYTLTSDGRPDVQAFRFTALRIKAAHCHTASGRPVQVRQGKPSRRWRILSGQAPEFGVEALKTGRETEGIPIFLKKIPHYRQLRFGTCGTNSPIHCNAPPQLDPAPAVHPKQ